MASRKPELKKDRFTYRPIVGENGLGFVIRLFDKDNWRGTEGELTTVTRQPGHSTLVYESRTLNGSQRLHGTISELKAPVLDPVRERLAQLASESLPAEKGLFLPEALRGLAEVALRELTPDS